jgi:hypothetical protein
MKRMTVREFRQQISKDKDPVIEVVRYHETIGYFLTKQAYEDLQSKKGKK